MRSSHIATAAALVFAWYTLAIPVDGNLYTQLVVRGDTPPEDWSSIPSDKKFQQTGRLRPQDGETGNNHITYKKDPAKPNNVNQYQVWKPNPYKAGKSTDGGRWRGNDEAGKSHGGIDPPIWHKGSSEPGRYNAYQATDRQNPPAYRHAQFSKALDNSGVMKKVPKEGNPQGKSKDDMGPIKSKNKAGAPPVRNTAAVTALPAKLGKAVGGKKGSKEI